MNPDDECHGSKYWGVWMMCVLAAAAAFLCMGGEVLGAFRSTLDKVTREYAKVAEERRELDDRLRKLQEQSTELDEEAQPQNDRDEHERDRLAAEIRRTEAELEQVTRELAQRQKEYDDLTRADKVDADEINRQLEAWKARVNKLAARRDVLAKRLKEEQDRLDKLPRMRVVGSLHEGSRATGTTALFVECRQSEIYLEPPRAAVSTWSIGNEQGAFLRAAKDFGYVVLLIRPEGYATFRKARDAIEQVNESASADQQIAYGYEPVDADWILQYPHQQEAGP